MIPFKLIEGEADGVRVVEQDGQHYLIMGAIAVPVERLPDGRWRAILPTRSEQKLNAQGGTDCTVHVPCLAVNALTGQEHQPN